MVGRSGGSSSSSSSSSSSKLDDAAWSWLKKVHNASHISQAHVQQVGQGRKVSSVTAER